jgi:hypothetical protein
VIVYHEYNLKPTPANSIYHKKEIGKPGETNLPLLKNDITRFFIDMIRVFYCSKAGLGLKFQIEIVLNLEALCVTYRRQKASIEMIEGINNIKKGF